MSRLVDPIHFFDARGRSVLSNEHLEAENDALRKENAELKARLNRLYTRIRQAREAKAAKS